MGCGSASDWPGLCLFCCYINPRVLSANRIDFGLFFLFHIFFQFTPPPAPLLFCSWWHCWGVTIKVQTSNLLSLFFLVVVVLLSFYRVNTTEPSKKEYRCFFFCLVFFLCEKSKKKNNVGGRSIFIRDQTETNDFNIKWEIETWEK